MKRLIILCCLLVTSAHAESTVLELGVLPGLRYDVKAFTVRPGASVKIVFKNNDTMQHNLVFTQPGKRMEVVDLGLKLGAEGPARHFVPDTPLVLYYTPVIAMNQQAVLEFVAPAVEDDYPFVCTFPGHGFLMQGIMTVSAKLPLKVERNELEPIADGTGWGIVTDRPRIVRTWVPHASPAAIVVALPGGQNYTWDAGTGHLRAVWREAGFIDYKTQRRHAESNGKPVVAWNKTPYYLEGKTFPFKIDGEVPAVDYKGYRLEKDGHPCFRYIAGGHLFTELIKSTSDFLGVTREFTVQGPVELTFQVPPEFVDRVSASAGTWDGPVLTIPALDSKSFTFTIHE